MYCTQRWKQKPEVDDLNSDLGKEPTSRDCLLIYTGSMAYPSQTNKCNLLFFFLRNKEREEFYNRQCGWRFGMKSEFLFEYVTKNGRSVKMLLAISEPSSNLASPDFAGRQPVCLWSVGAQSQSESTQPLLNHAKPPTWIGILPAGTGLLTSHFSFLLFFFLSYNFLWQFFSPPRLTLPCFPDLANTPQSTNVLAMPSSS